jgi:hypothetical protein
MKKLNTNFRIGINPSDGSRVNKSSINQNNSELSTGIMNLGLGKRLKLDNFIPKSAPLVSSSTLVRYDQK